MNLSKALLPAGIAALLLAGCGGSDNKPKVNTAPVAISDSVSTQAETPYKGTLKGTDVDRRDKLSFVIMTPPKYGKIDLTANGNYTYTPNAEYVGGDTFTFTTSDGTATSSPATVTVTVDLLQVSFNEYSRKAFSQSGTDKPLPLNSRKFTQDVTAPTAYDDLLAK